MAIKTKVDNQDVDTSLVDIPLFSTVDDAVKHIQVNDTSLTIQIEKEEMETDK